MKKKKGKLVFLEYCFLLDPSIVWGNLYEFENFLTDFFSAHGMDAQFLNGVTGYQGRRLLYIKQMEMLEPLGKSPEKQVGPQKSLKKLTKELPKVKGKK